MADLEIRLDATGLEDAFKQLDPRQTYTMLMLWFSRASTHVRDELRQRAPNRLKSKVYIRMDTLRPPRWARIGVKSPIGWLIEGGTGALGDPSFRHVARHWPSTAGIMAATGLPEPQAFLVARSIGMRGGNRPRPFVQPTYEATKNVVAQMARDAVTEVLRT